MNRYDKQILAIPRKLAKVRDMFNGFNWACVSRGNEIGWMWTEDSLDQKMAYAHKWLYYDWDRRSAYFQNFMRGNVRNGNYPYQVYLPFANATLYYFGKDMALMMATLFKEALDLYEKYGQQHHSEAYAEQNISWLKKNIKKFTNCAKNEITAERVNRKVI